MNISLLVSGNLGYQALQYIFSNALINAIATDKNSKSIIDFATENSIPLFVGNPRQHSFFEFMNQFDNSVLLSINYLFIINEDVINLFKYPVNFHGSLLPKYRGRTPHVWAIINNEKQCGVTAHYMDANCDTGEIILQETLDISYNDSGNDILIKYQDVYLKMIVQLLTQIQAGEISSRKQVNEKATYFGKRTPEDGLINWNWQAERIRNWVRALSNPYPGAFTFLQGEKIIIDWVELDDFGFSDNMPDGYILQADPNIIVKTPNSAIRITKLRNQINNVTAGQVLGI